MNDTLIKILTLLLYVVTMSTPCHGFSEQGTRKFRYIGTWQGLPDGNITSLLTDCRGALWIGTDAGLARYDGYEVMTVMDRAVSEICEDGEHNLWIRSGDALLRYIRKENRLDDDTEAFFTSIGIDSTAKEHVFTDGGKRLWVLTRKSLYRYDFAKRKLWRVTSGRLPQKRNREYISSAEDGMYIYIGGCGNRLWQVDKKTGRTVITSVPAELKNSRPCVYADRNGVLWAYSTLSEQLYRRVTVGENTEWQQVVLPPSDGVRSSVSANAIHQIADDGKGRVWIATDHRGLFCYDTACGAVTQHITAGGNRGDMAENNVNTLTVDKHGTLWLGHYKQGISYSSLDFSMFKRFARDCGDVSALFTDEAGTVWVGTDGNGLFRTSADGTPEQTPLRDMCIASMLQDRDGHIWVGPYNSGLYCMDRGGRIISKYSTADGSLPTDMSWKISEDDKGNIWVCSAFHPVLRLDPATGRYAYYKTPQGSDVYGMSITKDHAGRIYIGTSDGLCIYDTADGSQICTSADKDGSRLFLNRQAMALCYDSHDILWMGHYNGLTAWDMKTDSIWLFSTEERGICNNLVKSIQEDRDGNIWVSTAGGISRISVGDRAKGDFRVLNFKHIASESDNYFNQNSSAIASDGSVLFGCVRGYVGISPKAYRRSEHHIPQIFFSSITAGGKPLDETAEKLDLSHRDHSILLRLMTDNPAGSSEVRYAYTIGGDKEWIYINNPVISFASMASGSYLLRVKACNGDGVWSPERRLAIYVAPPFWLSPVMLCLYMLLVVLGVWWFVMRSRRRNIRRMDLERQRMEQDKNVRLAEMKLRFFTNVSHDLRTPLTLIISPLQMLLRETLPDTVMRRLQIMEKNARLLQDQINALLDFRRLDVGAERLRLQSGDIVSFVRDSCERFSSYATDRDISFGFDTDIDVMQMEFDHDKIHKIIYNLLSNAFKYTPDGRSICVTMRRLPDEVEISVADSGPGVADKDKQLVFERFYQSAVEGSADSYDMQHLTGSGIGLHIVSSYVRLMGGTVYVSDGESGGAVFSFRIPADENVRTCAEAVPDGLSETAGAFTVLVVDDNRDMCEFIGTSLADHYRVLTAADGAEAMDILGREAVSLVVSDVMMPVMDGLELCRRIKSDIQLSHIPVILLTARTAEDSVMEGYETGADDYLTKPFNIDMLKLRINKFIELAKMSHLRFQQKPDVRPEEITITTLDEQFIKQAIGIVEANMGDSDFSVEALGQALGMNRVALWKKLQAITGKGPADFIRNIRMKHGRMLLDQGRMNVSEIAYRVGYNTVKRFTENFKTEFGMTPSEYKKTLRK